MNNTSSTQLDGLIHTRRKLCSRLPKNWLRPLYLLNDAWPQSWPSVKMPQNKVPCTSQYATNAAACTKTTSHDQRWQPKIVERTNRCVEQRARMDTSDGSRACASGGGGSESRTLMRQSCKQYGDAGSVRAKATTADKVTSTALRAT